MTGFIDSNLPMLTILLAEFVIACLAFSVLSDASEPAGGAFDPHFSAVYIYAFAPAEIVVIWSFSPSVVLSLCRSSLREVHTSCAFGGVPKQKFS